MSDESIHELAVKLYEAQMVLDSNVRAAKWKMRGMGIGKEESMLASMRLIEESGEKIHEFLSDDGKVDYSKIPPEERDPYKQHRTLARELGCALFANYDSLSVTDQYITLSETPETKFRFSIGLVIEGKTNPRMEAYIDQNGKFVSAKLKEYK